MKNQHVKQSDLIRAVRSVIHRKLKLACLGLFVISVSSCMVYTKKTELLIEPEYNAMHVTLFVTQNGNQLSVLPRFENKGNLPIYVIQGTFGIGNIDVVETTATPVIEDEYVITLGGRRLQYIGQRAYAIAGPSVEEFVPIAPGQVVATRNDRLDESYSFESGTHTYTIVHMHLQLNKQTGEIKAYSSRAADFTFTRQ